MTDNTKSLDDEFQFHEQFTDNDLTNGLIFDSIYLPQEIVFILLTHVNPNALLKLTLVCKTWCNIIKSDTFWMTVYKTREPTKKVKYLPWYVYYSYFTSNNFVNLIKNGNGQQQLEHWIEILNYGNKFKVENIPEAVEPLPLNVPEFCGHHSCFATSCSPCRKVQLINFKGKRLIGLIMKKFQPHIYVSEWVAGVNPPEFAILYNIWFTIFYKSFLDIRVNHGKTYMNGTRLIIKGNEGYKWQKVEFVIKDYENKVQDNFVSGILSHEGRAMDSTSGPCECKMAGAVVKFLLETIEYNPAEENY